MQTDLSAPGRSLFSPPFPHTEDIIHRPWTILIAPCVSCSLQMQLGLGVLVRALANSPDSSRRCPPSGSYTMHPCHSQKAPIRGSMAQEQAGAAHVFSVCCLDPLLLLTQTGPFRTCPSASSLHLPFPSDSRLFSELHSELSESLSRVH